MPAAKDLMRNATLCTLLTSQKGELPKLFIEEETDDKKNKGPKEMNMNDMAKCMEQMQKLMTLAEEWEKHVDGMPKQAVENLTDLLFGMFAQTIVRKGLEERGNDGGTLSLKQFDRLTALAKDQIMKDLEMAD